MSKKQIIILLLASFLATIAVFRFVRNVFLGEDVEQSMNEVPDSVVFTEHIAPIIFNHCTQCHRKEGQAPFNLWSYSDVMRKKKTILKVISDGIMPPWPADPNYSNFIGENYLTDIEKKTMLRWAEQGFEKGADFKMPDPPFFPELSMIGEPDLTLYMDSIEVFGNNRDRFLVVKVPGKIARDTFVQSIEFVPGKDQLIHHLNGHLLNFDPDKKADVFDGTRVAEVELHPMERAMQFNALRMYHDDGSEPEVVHSAVNYLPGVIGTYYPEGIGGYRLNRKFAVVANDMHYAPIPETKWDRSHFNIFYAKSRPTRPTHELMLGTNGISAINPPLDIPPDSVVRVRTKYRMEKDISILTINPHMHLLGTEFLAYAVLPEGDTLPLISIPRWDFRWQYFYTFKIMQRIPAGSLIVAEGLFDNTNTNPNNPFNPPQRIKERQDLDGAGMRTTDEMFQFIITYLDYKEGDENSSLEPTNASLVKR